MAHQKEKQEIHSALITAFARSKIPQLRTAAGQLIREALRCYGSTRAASYALGISPRTMQRWLHQHPDLTAGLKAHPAGNRTGQPRTKRPGQKDD